MKKFLVLFATIFVALLFSTQTIFAVNNISKIDIEQLGDTLPIRVIENIGA